MEIPPINSNELHSTTTWTQIRAVQVGVFILQRTVATNRRFVRHRVVVVPMTWLSESLGTEKGVENSLWKCDFSFTLTQTKANHPIYSITCTIHYLLHLARRRHIDRKQQNPETSANYERAPSLKQNHVSRSRRATN